MHAVAAGVLKTCEYARALSLADAFVLRVSRTSRNAQRLEWSSYTEYGWECARLTAEATATRSVSAVMSIMYILRSTRVTWPTASVNLISLDVDHAGASVLISKQVEAAGSPKEAESNCKTFVLIDQVSLFCSPVSQLSHCCTLRSIRMSAPVTCIFSCTRLYLHLVRTSVPSPPVYLVAPPWNRWR